MKVTPEMSRAIIQGLRSGETVAGITITPINRACIVTAIRDALEALDGPEPDHMLGGAPRHD